MRNPNGYGSISKLSGSRRRPWIVRITTGYETDFDLKRTKQVQQVLGYYPTKKEAIRALADYNNNPFDLENAKITFRQCYEEAKKDFTTARAHNYVSAFKYLEPIADLPICSIKAAQMQKCINACQTTQQRDIKTVCRKTFLYAVQNEIVDRNPALYLKSNTVYASIVRDVFTADQIADLFHHADEWTAQVTLILLYTGMRTKELQDLLPEDIDLSERFIQIRKGKNKNSIRRVPLHASILPILDAWKKEGRQFSHNGLNKALRSRYGRLAHDCRHTFTTQMRKCGCDLLMLQLILGHAPKTITERVYTHVSEQELLDAVGLLDYGISAE